jgi:hypothetical protein
MSVWGILKLKAWELPQTLLPNLVKQVSRLWSCYWLTLNSIGDRFKFLYESNLIFPSLYSCPIYCLIIERRVASLLATFDLRHLNELKLSFETSGYSLIVERRVASLLATFDLRHLNELKLSFGTLGILPNNNTSERSAMKFNVTKSSSIFQTDIRIVFRTSLS